MQFFDRAAQVVALAGSDRFVPLGAALTGMQTFLAAAGAANLYEIPYLILDGNGTDWEFGIGVIDASAGSGDEFDRRSVIRSTNADARIVISGTGTTTVQCVHFGGASAVATPVTGGANEGPLCADEAPGVLSVGHGAYAGGENSTALGAMSETTAQAAVAIGARAISRVINAVASGDGKTGTARGHALTWTGSGTSSDTTSTTITDVVGNFSVADTTAYVIEAQIVGRRTAPSAGIYGATIRALVLRSGAGAPTIAGQAKTDVTGGLVCDCSLSVVGNEVAVNAQGAASGETWLWAATIRATEQRGA